MKNHSGGSSGGGDQAVTEEEGGQNDEGLWSTSGWEAVKKIFSDTRIFTDTMLKRLRYICAWDRVVGEKLYDYFISYMKNQIDPSCEKNKGKERLLRYAERWKQYKSASGNLTSAFENVWISKESETKFREFEKVCMALWRDHMLGLHFQTLLAEATKAIKKKENDARDAAQTFVDSCKLTGSHLEEIQSLLDHPLIWDDNGDTKLHKVIKEGNLDRVKDFLVDGRRKDRHGKTPLLVACEVGDANIVAEVLEKFKEDLNEPDSDDNSPVTVTKNPQVMHLLYKAGVDWAPLAKRSEIQEKIRKDVAQLRSALGQKSFAFTSFLMGSEMIRKKQDDLLKMQDLQGMQEDLPKIPSKPVSFGFQGYRFPFKGVNDLQFQEVVFVLINGEIVFGMLCEEYPSEKRAYLSYLEAMFSGLGLAKIVIAEYARFLSVRYPDISLHIWADPPPKGVNYIFRGSKQPDFFGRPPPDPQAQRPAEDLGKFANSLQKEYHKYLKEAKFQCDIFEMEVALPQPPTFLSNADKRKFRVLHESIQSLSTALHSLINVHFEATLVCPIQRGIRLESETGDEKEYLKSEFLLDTSIDFGKDAKAAQKFLFQKLDSHADPVQGHLGGGDELGKLWHDLADRLLQQ